jgi:hypothetical protein
VPSGAAIQTRQFQPAPSDAEITHPP